MRKFFVVKIYEHYDGFATYSSADYLETFDSANDAYNYLDKCKAEEPYTSLLLDISNSYFDKNMAE
jgi:hypothetical protein